MAEISWPRERVAVTGGAGFLGRYVVEELRRRGARDVFVPRSSDYDLVDMAAVRRFYSDAKPTVVFHNQPPDAGIAATRMTPGKW